MTTSIIAGSKFEFSTDDTTFTEVKGIQTLPDFREESGEREVTSVSDTVRQYDNEMDSPTEQELTAFYIKSDAEQLAFRTLARQKGACTIKVTYSDGETVTFEAKLKNYGIMGGDAPSTKMWACVIRRTAPIEFDEASS